MKFELIREQPAKVDQLGSHTKVAHALVQLLSADLAVRSIGLLGRWGSGKSTTVNLARDIIDGPSGKSQGTLFFEYDAWAQQSDPPRRAFLESLARFLSENGAAPKDAWKEEIDHLIRRTEIHDIETTPTLSIWGAWLAVSLAAVPIGIYLGRSDDDLWRHVGNILLFGPIIILGFSRLAASILVSTNRKGAKEAHSMAVLFFNKTVDKVRNTILRTPDPTSIDFRDGFYNIISHEKVRNRSIVIVVDNLDRVATNDAITMWAAIRVLIDSSEERSGHASFKFIVPFDQIEIQRLFQEDEKPLSSEAARKAQAFVEKTFDAILIVGPPIDSDWRSYLDGALTKALKENIPASSRIHAIRIFEEFIEQDQRVFETTPRRLNSYVNLVVTTWLQWHENISFAAIAYYCARNVWADSTLLDVFSPEASAKTLMDRIATDWKMEVAAIHYGVPPEKARQLVLQPEIEKVAGGTEFEDFSELAVLPGFTRILESWLVTKGSDPFGGLEPHQVLNLAAFMRASLEVGAETEEAWAALEAAGDNHTLWTKPTAHARAGAEALRARGSVVPQSLLASLRRKDSQLSPADWLESVDALLPSEGRQQALRNVKAPFEGPAFLTLLQDAAERGWLKSQPELVRALEPREPREAVIAALEAQVSTEHPNAVLQTLRSLVHIPGEWPVKPLVAALEARAMAAPELLSPLIESLLLIADEGQEALGRLGDNGSLADLLAEGFESGDSRAQAVAAYALSFGSPGRLSGETGRGKAAKGWSLLQNLSTKLENSLEPFLASYRDISATKSPFNSKSDAVSLRFLLAAAKSNPSWRALLRDQLLARLEKGTLGESNYAEDTLNHAPFIKSIVGEEVFRRFVVVGQRYKGWTEAFKVVGADVLWAIASAAKRLKKGERTRIDEIVTSRLASMTAGEWTGIITTPPPYLDDLLTTTGKVLPADAKEAFYNGFDAWADGFVSGSGSTALSPRQAAHVFTLLPAPKRRTWARSLLDALRTTPPERALTAIAALGDAIISALPREPVPDLIARTVILRSIINATPKLDELLSNNWSFVCGIVTRSQSDTQAEICDHRDWLERIGQLRSISDREVADELTSDR